MDVSREGTETTEGLVLHPSPSAPRARRQLIEGASLACVLVAGLTFLEMAAGSVLGWFLIGMSLVWYGLLPLLYFRNACIYVHDGRVGAANLFGRRRETDVAKVAAVTVVGTGRRARRIVLEGAGGERLLAVYATAWHASQIDALRGALGK